MDALKGQRNHRHLDYNDLARAVEENENMYFLRGKFLIFHSLKFLFFFKLNIKIFIKN